MNYFNFVRMILTNSEIRVFSGTNSKDFAILDWVIFDTISVCGERADGRTDELTTLVNTGLCIASYADAL